MLDHVGLQVSDVPQSKAFYEKALAPLGYKVLMDFGEAVGFGIERPDFWIHVGGDKGATHVAFAAESRNVVEAFHEAALAAGGSDNGGPGLREIYHPTYYGAFVFDPDGNNIEAVTHVSE
jgi:catechol 2,3-dioxygenase-like lactoylglutathione lyase family enzyme